MVGKETNCVIIHPWVQSLGLFLTSSKNSNKSFVSQRLNHIFFKNVL